MSSNATTLSYDALRTRFAPAIARIASGYEADGSRQQDLQQEIHLAIWRGLPGFRGDCTIGTWVYRVANNVAASFVAKEVRQKRGSLISLEELDEPPVHPGHEAEVDHRLQLEALRKFLRMLNLPDRQIALLYLEGLPASEIGDITGLRPAAVAMRIHRLKAVLARLSGNAGDENG